MLTRAVLFGVGSYFHNYETSLPKLEIIGYGYSEPDLATSKSSRLQNGKKVYCPSDLVSDPDVGNDSPVEIYICSGPVSSAEIFFNLKKSGVRLSRIKFIDESGYYKLPTLTYVDQAGNMVRRVNGADFIVVANSPCNDLISFDGHLSAKTTFDLYESISKKVLFESLKSPVFAKILSDSQKKVISEINTVTKQTDKNKLYFAVGCEAGLGDCLIILNFLKKLRAVNPDEIIIDFYSHHDSFFKELKFVRRHYPFNLIRNTDTIASYDVVLKGIFALKTVFVKWDKVKRFSKIIYQYCESSRYISERFFYKDYFLARDFIYYSRQKKRLFTDSPDVERVISSLYPDSISYSDFTSDAEEKGANVLCRYHLSPNQYVVLNLGVNGKFSSHPKLWSKDRFSELVSLIKSGYPAVKVVQAGANDFYGRLSGVDLDLLGKTSAGELLTLLINARCLVSCEGGLVHLNHFIGKKAVVLFGPTGADYYGYEENTNLSGKAPQCCGECVLLGRNCYFEGCMLSSDKLGSLCMDSISVSSVFSSVSKFLD